MARADIVEVRHLYQAIEQAVETRGYSTADTSWVCDNGAVELEIQATRDEAGTIRRLRVQGGSGDSYQTITYYYDARGHLRFAFAARSAVNGTHQEVRVYWDPDDKLLYRDVRTVAGPGWAWGETEEVRKPDSWLRGGCR